MGNVLDATIKKILIDNETINSDYSSEVIDIDNREGAFSLQVNYSNGVGPVDIDVAYQLSIDGINFVTVTSEEINIPDESGTALIDILATGASFLRLRFIVNSGSIDVTTLYSGKRRH